MTQAGASAPAPCAPGTYSNMTGQSACVSSPPGYYVPFPGAIVPLACTIGHYCATTNMTAPTACGVGTFNAVVGATNASACTPCSPGHACESSGLSAPSSVCDAGFACSGGSPVRNPGAGSVPCLNSTTSPVSLAYGSPCSVGGFCVAGTAVASGELCPPSTYQPAYGASNASSCLPCPSGVWCGASGLSSASGSGNASAGYFTNGSATTPTQWAAPLGTMTQAGASAPAPCAPGTYSNMTGQSACVSSPAGWFAQLLGTIDVVICPPNSFCRDGTIFPSLCPDGWFGGSAGLMSASQCSICPSTHFCSGGIISGTCSAGYVCLQGNGNPRPELADGVPATVGYVCPRCDSYHRRMVPAMCVESVLRH